MAVLINSILILFFLLQNGPTGKAEYGKDKQKADCDCYVDGIYYQDGDTWQDHQNPCVKYECTNGYYEAVEKGCMFNNECKDVNSTWTEKCFSYQCYGSGNTAYYNLIEGGCLDRNGNCLKFGQRSQINCDIVECQIVDDCYEITTVSKGCMVENHCKSLHSFWNVGCSVYQCIEENKQTRYIELQNDVMNWPEGEYGFLMSKHGCPPRSLPGEFEKGSRLHYSLGHSFVSPQFDAFGNYSETSFQHHFCSHVDIQDKQQLPRYQTYWDPGDYCILRRNGTCPASFTEGFITFEDFDGLEVLPGINGTLPDGYYDKNTTIYFCCRSDGNLDKPIVLPRDFPFILFRGKSGCQTVRGMTHTVENFAFDNVRKNGTLYENGSIPMTSYDKNATIVYFCYYKPLQCGCKDGDGNVIQVRERLRKNCVEYMCEDFIDYQDLIILRGGCMYNGVCKNEYDTWIESSGETCEIKTCRRLVSDINITFSVMNTLRGCKDEQYCRPVGYQKTRGCYTMQCKKSMYSDRMDFTLKKAGCSDGRGGCVDLGKSIMKGCFEFKCRKEPSKCGLEIAKGGCRWKNKCRANGEEWDDDKNCMLLKCNVTQSSKGWKIKVQSTPKGCKFDGKCIEHLGNFTHPMSCATYQCKAERKGIKWYTHIALVNTGCRYQSKCRANGEEWDDDKYCLTRKCNATKSNQGWKIKILSNPKGCRYQNKCRAHGEEWDDGKNCLSRKCNAIQTSKGWKLKILSTPKGCKIDGKCIEILGNFTHPMSCATYQCKAERKGIKWYTHIALVNTGCRYQNRCRANGEEWGDEQNCITQKCNATQTSKGWKHKILSTPKGCRYQNKCRAHGEEWDDDKNCLTQKCNAIQTSKGWILKILSTPKGCRYQNRCRANGEEWDDDKNCLTRKCNATKTSKGWKLKILSIPKACRNMEGGCIKLGTKIRESNNCFERQCKMQYGHPNMVIIKGGCKVGGKCIEHLGNITHPLSCATYQCKAERKGAKWYTRLSLANEGCRWKNKCRAIGEEWDDDNKCFIWKCNATQTSSRLKAKVQSTPKACADVNKNCPHCG